MSCMSVLLPIAISIHAPREGSDADFIQLALAFLQFQSTLPVRGATTDISQAVETSSFQSTLPVRGATTGGRQAGAYIPFQSTLPVRGATNVAVFFGLL